MVLLEVVYFLISITQRISLAAIEDLRVPSCFTGLFHPSLLITYPPIPNPTQLHPTSPAPKPSRSNCRKTAKNSAITARCCEMGRAAKHSAMIFGRGRGAVAVEAEIVYRIGGRLTQVIELREE